MCREISTIMQHDQDVLFLFQNMDILLTPVTHHPINLISIPGPLVFVLGQFRISFVYEKGSYK